MSIAFLVRCVIGVAVGLSVAPVVLFCLWPRALRSWFESGPDGIDALATPAARDLIAALRELGFEALGVKVEKTPLRAMVRELAFVAGDRRCYASVGNRRRRPRLYYYTPVSTGGLVLTSNGAFPKIQIDTKVATDGVVAFFGWASGTAREDPSAGRARSWRIPAAWKAVVRDGFVTEWQVFCDVEPMLRSMGTNRW